MRFKFVGDNGEGPAAVTLFGVTFEKGVPTDVPAATVRKLAANRHFEAVEADDLSPPKEPSFPKKPKKPE